MHTYMYLMVIPFSCVATDGHSEERGTVWLTLVTQVEDKVIMLSATKMSSKSK